MFERNINKKRGFTLVEIIVVFVILGFLAMMFFSILNRAKEKSLSAHVAQSAVQFRKAMELYASDHNGTYPGEGSGAPFFYAGKIRQSDGSYNSYGPANIAGVSSMEDFEDLVDEYLPTGILESPITGQVFTYYYNPNVSCLTDTNRYVILIQNDGVFETDSLPYYEVGGVPNSAFYCVPGPEN